MKPSKKLPRAVLAAVGGAALAGASAPASAATVLTFGGGAGTGTLLAQGWNGANNSYAGWAHNSDWYTVLAPSTGTVDIKVIGTVAAAQPAFTVWSTGSTNLGAGAPSDHSYNQIGGTSWLLGNFVGFANNSVDAHFGAGPANTGLGGLSALVGTIAEIGTDGSGNKYAELFFPNATPGTYYTIAVGGSGGGGGYQITAGPGTAPVPLPAAVWLFGSALAGLLGIGRRKSAA